MADTKKLDYATCAMRFHQLEAAERLAVYIDTGPEAINYLERKSEVHLYAIPGHPDYRPHPGAATGGRPLGPIPFRWAESSAPTSPCCATPIKEWTIFGGMMVGREDIPHLVGAFKRPESFWYTIKLLVRYAADRLRYNRGTRLVLGNALVGRFFSVCARPAVRSGRRPSRPNSYAKATALLALSYHMRAPPCGFASKRESCSRLVVSRTAWSGVAS